ncbi:Replication protein A DNA-binding subunit B [Zea mays]|uniref:Replication protein A DNA-binding subunit B n=1 Tax=Zea mays TaxID=4577 RepID=A0A3L6F2E2_MAIZE|nr:Replication protein A DNA-binding subunit B [Zea mays]
MEHINPNSRKKGTPTLQCGHFDPEFVKTFKDVLGMLTQINPPHLIGYNNSTIIRDIFIKNTSDMSLKITLWGNQASSFSISDVYNQSNNQPIVILLVGFLAKRFKGQPYLSSTTASSWYFNPGIPEAQTYYNRLQNNDLQQIQPTAAEEEILLSQPPNLDQKTVEELLNIDLDMFPPEGYRCTVTISRIVQNSKWWYPSCSRCHKSSSQTSTGYHCTSCGCTDINFRYKLNFIATDGTCEAEFFCFDSIARKIVGKPCDNLVTAVATSQGPPAALAAIVCLKFTLAVTINMSAYSVTNRVFSILSILTNHGRQTLIPSNMPSHPQQELDTQDEIPSLTTTQDSPATSMAKLSTCSNERNESDAQRISELNNEELSSPPKRYLLIAHLSRALSLLDNECFPIDMNPIKSTITFGP